MNLTATHINYFMICKRKLWLFANGINMEHTSDIVAEGKLIHETTYPQRPERYSELEIDGSVIDFYDAHNKIIHEIKKSDKMEEAHEWQVKYYIWLLKKNGVDGATGILEYPKLRETTYYLFNPGVLSRKDNTLKFVPIESDANGENEREGQATDSLIIFTSRNEKWLEKEIIGTERSFTDNFI